MKLVTSCWYKELPDGYCRIGISRGVPRGQPAGYKMYRKLQPGTWFSSAPVEQYVRLYREEVLDRLDPQATVDELLRLADGKMPALLCFEMPSDARWCHRGMVSMWLKETLGLDVFEYECEQKGCGSRHPKLPSVLMHS